MKLKIQQIELKVTLRQNMGSDNLNKVLDYIWEHFFGTHTIREAVHQMLESNTTYLGYGAWALHETWNGRSWYLTFTGASAHLTPIGHVADTDERKGRHIISLD